jgi:hypothetical protein
VLGVTFQRALEPHTLAIGAHPKHYRRDMPRAFILCVRSRTLAGVVMAVESSREIACFTSVRRGPALRLKDVATKYVRSSGHDRVAWKMNIYI